MPTANRNIGLPLSAHSGQYGAAVLRWFQRELTGNVPAADRKIKRRELSFIFRNLATLIENGLSLPKALDTLAKERLLRKHGDVLFALLHKVETGEMFSGAMADFPAIFNQVLVSQIKAGERSGTIVTALGRVARQLESSTRIRAKVIRQLSYPAVLVTAGALAVTFILVFVIPIFEETYAAAHIPLPLITRLLMAAGEYAASYGWIVLVGIVAAVIGLKRARRGAEFALWMDGAVLRWPLVGDWLRNMAVLQFMDVFGNLLESGFKLVDALEVSSASVSNKAVRQCVRTLQAAVTRGERFGHELDRMDNLFPPVVSQLIAVGERTGSLPNTMAHIRDHLEEEIDRQTNALVGTIEPIVTITLAAIIACILLAVYLPMFDMIGAAGQM
jgi:type II secretory pathway component PulF